jgi:hypothetical protein
VVRRSSSGCRRGRRDRGLEAREGRREGGGDVVCGGVSEEGATDILAPLWRTRNSRAGLRVFMAVVERRTFGRRCGVLGGRVWMICMLFSWVSLWLCHEWENCVSKIVDVCDLLHAADIVLHCLFEILLAPFQKVSSG